MRLALVIFTGGLLLIAIVIMGRWFDAQTWRRALTAYRIYLPTNLTPDDITAWLTNVSASTHPPAWSLLTLPPVAWETVATHAGITHYLLVTKSNASKTLAGLRASLPGVRVEEAPEYVAQRPAFKAAAEAILTNHTRPLATDYAEATTAAILASLQPLHGSEEIRIQWIMTSGGTPKPVHSASPNPNDRWWSGYLLDGDTMSSEAARALRLKQRTALLQAVCRVGVAAPTRARAYRLLGQVWPTLHASNAPGVQIRRRWLPGSLVADRIATRTYPLTRWPLTISAEEGAALLGFPLGKVALPGLSLSRARQLPPSPNMPTRGAILGASNYPGMTNRSLALSVEDRTRHTYVVAPTGSGKSVLLTRLILGDIEAGHGVIALDLKGDLVPDILARARDEDAERIIVVDASKRDMPIGFNPLAHAHTEAERELVTDGVLHVFKELWSAYWGPRSDAVMRASIATLTNVRAVNGSDMTLCEVLPLLAEPAFRRYVLNQPTMPDTLKGFWARYEAQSDNAREQAIAPLINKLEAFTQRTPIRLMLGQSHSKLDFGQAFRERKVVLVSLAQGALGTDTSQLLGSLMVFQLWKAALERVNIPQERRRPVFAYIDEAQQLVKLPIPLPEMLAQARGFKLALTLTSQYLSQLPDSVRAAVLQTVRTQIAFAVEPEDARILAQRFSPLTADELQGLAAWEMAIRPCINGATGPVVTGASLPLSEPLRSSDELADVSRQRYGTPRSDVEANLQARTEVPATRRLGREPSGGSR